jgi:hypothetical protein
MADRFALNIGGMNPIDEGAALGFSQGPVAPMMNTGARSR